MRQRARLSSNVSRHLAYQFTSFCIKAEEAKTPARGDADGQIKEFICQNAAPVAAEAPC